MVVRMNIDAWLKEVELRVGRRPVAVVHHPDDPIETSQEVVLIPERFCPRGQVSGVMSVGGLPTEKESVSERRGRRPVCTLNVVIIRAQGAWKTRRHTRPRGANPPEICPGWTLPDSSERVTALESEK
jgi:hypothetical protein